MKKFGFAILAGAMLVSLAAPGAAQLGAGYQGLAFVRAVKDRDGDKAQQALGDNPTPAVINARDGDGNTALIISVSRRDPDFTGFLLNKGADPDLSAERSGDTPLIIASRLGFDQAVEWLIGVGAKIDATNKMGETALITAVQQRQIPIVRRLLEAGADPDKTDTAQGFSARQYAERDSRGREILQMINAKKPKVSAAR